MVTEVTVPDENETWFHHWCQKFGWQLSNRMGQSNTRPRSSVMKLESNPGYWTYGVKVTFTLHQYFYMTMIRCLTQVVTIVVMRDILPDNVNNLQSKYDETEGA